MVPVSRFEFVNRSVINLIDFDTDHVHVPSPAG